MPGKRGTAIVAAAVVAALFAIAGCGGDDGGDGAIPQDTSDEMLAAADEIQAANEAGDCETAQAQTTELRNQVGSLGDGQVKRSLDAMVTRLDENLDDECEETETGVTDTEEEPVPEEEVPVDPAPVPEETAPTEEETEPAPEEEEPSTPEQPQGEGGGPNGTPQTPPGQSGGGGGGSVPPTGGIDEG